MTIEEFFSLRPGDRIRHKLSSHTLRIAVGPNYGFIVFEKNLRLEVDPDDYELAGTWGRRLYSPVIEMLPHD